jgi:hypothetical protein
VETYKHWLEVIGQERVDPGQKLQSGLAVSRQYSLPYDSSMMTLLFYFDVRLTPK